MFSSVFLLIGMIGGLLALGIWHIVIGITDSIRENNARFGTYYILPFSFLLRPKPLYRIRRTEVKVKDTGELKEYYHLEFKFFYFQVWIDETQNENMSRRAYSSIIELNQVRLDVDEAFLEYTNEIKGKDTYLFHLTGRDDSVVVDDEYIDIKVLDDFNSL